MSDEKTRFIPAGDAAPADAPAPADLPEAPPPAVALEAAPLPDSPAQIPEREQTVPVLVIARAADISSEPAAEAAREAAAIEPPRSAPPVDPVVAPRAETSTSTRKSSWLSPLLAGGAALLAGVALWMARARAFAPAGSWTRPALYAGAALALGWIGASALGPSTAEKREAGTATLALQTDLRVARLADDVRALREAVAALAKPGRPRGADELKPVQDRLAALSESLERFRQDQATRAAALGAAVDRVEKLDREAATRLAQLAERLDRIERQMAPMTTGGIAAATVAAAPPPVTAAPAQQAAPAPAPQKAAIPAPPPRPADGVTDIPQTRPTKAVEGWALRDIYDGVALIESRRHGMVEVTPGQRVRGLGRIEKIERRGRHWVVVTDQGVIAAN